MYMRSRPHLEANPILVKEIRSRMRGPRAFIVLTVVLLLLGVVSYALYRIIVLTSSYSRTPLSPQIGQALFVGLAVLELIMVCFLTPAITASAISTEREQQTYEMLLVTPLLPGSILRGKLVSALSYVFLLLFAAVPMASLVFIFGGVAPRDMLRTFVVLLAVAVTLGMIGVFMSAWLKRTARATVVSYLVVLFLLLGPFLVYALVAILRQAEPPRWILIPDPLSALFSALLPSLPGSDPGTGLVVLGMILGGQPGVMNGSPLSSTGVPRPLYHYSLLLYAALTLVLYLLAVRLVQPVHRWRLARREALGALALLFLLAGTGLLAFTTTAGRYDYEPPPPRPTPAPVVVMAPPPSAVRKVVKAEPTAPPPPTPTPVPANASPLATPTPLPSPTLDPAEVEETAIYAAVVRHLCTVDHTFGDGPPNFPIVYLVQWTDDSVGDPEVPRTDARLLSTTVQDGVIRALADLPAEFRWVAGREDVPLEEVGGRVADGGAIITLGNLHVQEDATVHVSASLYFASLGATGKTYILQQVDGAWQVVGTTGVEWIS
jgi:ABC-2 type transport system permease protein